MTKIELILEIKSNASLIIKNCPCLAFDWDLKNIIYEPKDDVGFKYLCNKYNKKTFESFIQFIH